LIGDAELLRMILEVF